MRPRHHQNNGLSAASPRRSRWPPRPTNEAPSYKQTVPASAQREAGSMSALSLTPNVREHRFQMDHYTLQARDLTYKLAV